ncbi:DUF2637 domain-containing protein [Streptomyces sp. NPDC058848]|uniref:DUF2637 domain-containing protein n=1 Tax=unclassified Streptomyces TaxID=2593676 RepID=UPI00369BDC21
MKTPPASGRRLSQPIRLAWALVLGMLLAAAAWSLSGQLMDWGMADWMAWPLSIMFDAAGLICATYARRAVERGTPAGLARLALLAFVAVAGVLNFNHGHDIGGLPAGAGFASLSVGVELLFELHRRDVRDEQRAARGLIAERLPHIPLLGWVMYPGRSWATLRRAVGVRLDLLDPVQTGQQDKPEDTRDKTGRAEGTVRSAVLAVLATIPDATVDDVLDQLDALGIDADEDTVRAVLDNRRDTQDSRSQGILRPIAPPGQSVADTIRTALSSGLQDKDKVLSYVRGIHGPGVPRSTVVRTFNRLTKKSA